MPQLTLQSEQAEVHIRVESAPSSVPNVFALATQIQKWARRLFPALCRAWLQARLAEDLGPRYTREQAFAEGSHRCPDCGGRRAKRKSWRSRKVALPRWGTLQIERPYLRCRSCGRSWAPYDQALGLEGKRTYHWQGLKRPIEQAVQTSYRRAAKAHPESPSSSTLHRRMQKSPSLPLRSRSGSPRDGPRRGASPTTNPTTPAVGTGLADGTRVPAQQADTQHSLVLAHAVRRSQAHPEKGPQQTVLERTGLERTVLAAYAGPEAELPDRLAKNTIRPTTLLGDGRTDLSGTAQLVGRGRWHVPHTAGLLLHRDGTDNPRRRRVRKQVADLVFAEASPSERRRAIARWVWAMRHALPRTARHLLNAADGLARMDAHPEAFVVETTAPIEREMHEVGRRFENGGQWSRQGATAMARWWQLWRHHPNAFDRIFSDAPG